MKLIDIILITILLLSLIQLSIFVYFDTNGYNIKCNLFLCSVTKSVSETYIDYICYRNGIKINCSDLDVRQTITFGMGNFSEKIN